MMETTEQVRKRNLAAQGLTAVLSIAVAVLGFLAMDARTQLFYVGVGAPLLFTALVGIGRLTAAKEPMRVAAVSIQQSWIVLSVSIAFLALIPASFFDTALPVRGVAGTLAAILILTSALLLLDTRKRTGVDLSI